MDGSGWGINKSQAGCATGARKGVGGGGTGRQVVELLPGALCRPPPSHRGWVERELPGTKVNTEEEVMVEVA